MELTFESFHCSSSSSSCDCSCTSATSDTTAGCGSWCACWLWAEDARQCCAAHWPGTHFSLHLSLSLHLRLCAVVSFTDILTHHECCHFCIAGLAVFDASWYSPTHAHVFTNESRTRIYIYLYIFTYIYTYIYIYMHIYIYVCTYVCIYTYMNMYIPKNTYTHIYTCICTHVYMDEQDCTPWRIKSPFLP